MVLVQSMNLQRDEAQPYHARLLVLRSGQRDRACMCVSASARLQDKGRMGWYGWFAAATIIHCMR